MIAYQHFLKNDHQPHKSRQIRTNQQSPTTESGIIIANQQIYNNDRQPALLQNDHQPHKLRQIGTNQQIWIYDRWTKNLEKWNGKQYLRSPGHDDDHPPAQQLGDRYNKKNATL